MPQKRKAVSNSSNNAPATKLQIRASSLSPPVIPPKRQSSTKSISRTKREALPKTNLKRVTSSAVLEVSDEGESQNPEFDDGDQSSQTRQPAVNSDVLPLPWKGRLGFAYILCFLRLTIDVWIRFYVKSNPRYFVVEHVEWTQFLALWKRKVKVLNLPKI